MRSTPQKAVDRLGEIISERKLWLFLAAFVAVTLFHYLAPGLGWLARYPLTRQAVGRILFLIPVAGAAYHFGPVGGLLTLALAVLAMMPRVLFISASPADAFVEVIAVAVIGYLVVWMLESYRRIVSRLRTLNVVTSVLTESLDLHQVLHDVLDRLLGLIHAEAGALYLLEAEEQGLMLIAHRNLPADLTEGLSGLQSARMLTRYPGLRCRLAMPLCSRDQTNGLLVVGSSRPCPRLQREKELITTICRQISIVVENARLYESIARQLEIERSVYNVVQELTSELDIDKVIPKVIQIAQRLVGGDGGVVALWDEARSVIAYPYLHNLPLKLSTVTVSRGGGVAGEVMITGQPMVVEDYPDYPNAVPEFVAAGVTSVAAVPIMSGDRIFGALAVVSLGQAKGLPERDLAVLNGIGRQAGIAVENAYLYGNLRFYARRITHAQEEERKRIARELHDDTIQSLIALSRRLESLSTSGEHLSEAASRYIRDLWEQTDDTIQRVRRFSKNLRPSILDDLGLLPTLEELTADLNRQAGLRADFEVVGQRRRLSSEVELTLFRVAQEALTNVRKHAQATHVLTRIEVSDGLVQMTVQDNGKGFRPPAFTESRTTESELGLIGMHERVRLLGGTLVIESALGQGTRVIVSVPV